MIAEVAFPIPVKKLFSYSVPENLQDKMKKGARVLAPFGSRDSIGWLVNVVNAVNPPETDKILKLKNIKEVIDAEPLITEQLFELAMWIAEYYVCHLGLVLDAIISHNFNPAGKMASEKALRIEKKLSAYIPLQEQKEIIEDIKKGIYSNNFKSYVLKGDSDTGKTEIYMQCMAAAQEEKKTALLLVPEIALTEQFVRMLEERFGKERVGVWHSKISKGKRLATWQACRQGNVDVVIGTMSAIFLPFKNTGLIIVDEEQDSSYKQDRMPFYNVRDVAIKRAELEKAVVILSSSTPSMETYYKAENNEHKLLTITQRIGQEELPCIKVVDMRENVRIYGRPYGLSAELYRAIKERVSRKEQVILFLNRRGYFRQVLCKTCGTAIRCPDCGALLVYYMENKSLFCHHCSCRKTFCGTCPECKSRNIVFSGSGTQRIEKELSEKVPGIRIARLDSDAVKKKEAAEQIFYDFRRGRTDVLIGTQLVVKGWDFPGVTLVGILSADELLCLPDFRSSERFFSTIVQAAGRSGRGNKRGEVYIQTYDPLNKMFKKIINYDYLSFYRDELIIRRELAYPPFSQLVNIIIYGKNEDEVKKISAKVKSEIDAFSMEGDKNNIAALGPASAPAGFSKPKGSFRRQIIVKRILHSTEECRFQKLLEKLQAAAQASSVRIKIDVDPVNML